MEQWINTHWGCRKAEAGFLGEHTHGSCERNGVVGFACAEHNMSRLEGKCGVDFWSFTLFEMCTWCAYRCTFSFMWFDTVSPQHGNNFDCFETAIDRTCKCHCIELYCSRASSALQSSCRGRRWSFWWSTLIAQQEYEDNLANGYNAAINLGTSDAEHAMAPRGVCWCGGKVWTHRHHPWRLGQSMQCGLCRICMGQSMAQLIIQQSPASIPPQ